SSRIGNKLWLRAHLALESKFISRLIYGLENAVISLPNSEPPPGRLRATLSIIGNWLRAWVATRRFAWTIMANNAVVFTIENGVPGPGPPFENTFRLAHDSPTVDDHNHNGVLQNSSEPRAVKHATQKALRVSNPW